MDTKFPIVNLTKGAAAAPLAHIRELIGSFILMFIAVGITAAYAIFNGLTMDIIMGIGDPANSALAEQYGGILLITYVLAIFIVGSVSSYLFNYWVRLGALGQEGAKFETTKAAIVATLTNMVKFALIFLLIGIVIIVITFVLPMIGIGASQEELTASIQGEMSVGILLTNIVNLIVICVIYSLFSANLTQTALKSDKEDLQHPHTVDFSVVLFLLYLVAFIPTTILGLLGIMWVNMAVQATLGVYVAFAIAVAHGLRYRICVAEKESAQE